MLFFRKYYTITVLCGLLIRLFCGHFVRERRYICVALQKGALLFCSRWWQFASWHCFWSLIFVISSFLNSFVSFYFGDYCFTFEFISDIGCINYLPSTVISPVDSAYFWNFLCFCLTALGTSSAIEDHSSSISSLVMRYIFFPQWGQNVYPASIGGMFSKIKAFSHAVI